MYAFHYDSSHTTGMLLESLFKILHMSISQRVSGGRIDVRETCAKNAVVWFF